MSPIVLTPSRWRRSAASSSSDDGRRAAPLAALAEHHPLIDFVVSDAAIAADATRTVDTVVERWGRPLGRRGAPDEVAAWIVSLASSTAAWVTGQVLTVDGGLDAT